MAAFTFNAGQSNYTGEVLGDLLTLTAQENETYKEGLIHIKSGIQKKYALPSVRLGKIIQDHKATPNSSVGEYQFAERYLEPEDFMIYLEFNPATSSSITVRSSRRAILYSASSTPRFRQQ